MSEKLNRYLTVTTLKKVKQEDLKGLVGEDIFSLLRLSDDTEISDEHRERIERLIAEKIITTSTPQTRELLQQKLEQAGLCNTDLANMNGEKYRKHVAETEDAYLTILDYHIEHLNASGKVIPLFKKDFFLDDGKAIFDFLSDIGVSYNEIVHLNEHLVTAIQRGETEISLIVSAQCDDPDEGVIYVDFPSDERTVPLALFPISGRKLLKILHLYTSTGSLYTLFGVKKDDIDKMKNGGS